MLTDGRPSAFSGSFPVAAASTCTNRTQVGVIDTPVGWPPATSGGTTTGVLQSTYQSAGAESTTLAATSPGCKYAIGPTTSNMHLDITNFPLSVRPADFSAGYGPFFTTQATNSDMTTFTGAGTLTTSPQAIRYAAFNVADNIATMIRTDTSINPVIFVIGLNNNNGEEALDADWLARVANDKDYLDINGNHVYQPTQSEGQYFNVTATGVGTAFQQIASEILRLSK
jgi:hypothetical protein